MVTHDSEFQQPSKGRSACYKINAANTHEDFIDMKNYKVFLFNYLSSKTMQSFKFIKDHIKA